MAQRTSQQYREPENCGTVPNLGMMSAGRAKDMRQKIAAGVLVLCCGLAACRPGPALLPWDNPPPPGDLRADREACNRDYPARIGNFVPHAQCVNAAIERDAMPSARDPHLVYLQEQLRLKYSAQIDSGAITPRDGAQRMNQVDALVAAGNGRQLEAMMQQR